MNKLLEIFGRAISIDTADLLWHWLNAVVPSIWPDQDQPNELCEAIELMGNMDLEKAHEKLKFYLYENPDCTCGRMAATAICLHENDIDQAVEQLQSIYMREPSNTMALYALGYCFERKGNPAQAVDFYQDCLKFKSHLQLPRQRLAALYFKSGQLERTIREYELLTTEHPEDITSFVLLGYLYMAGGDYENAMESFNTAIVAHPDNFQDDTNEDEVEQWINDGLYEKAIEHVQQLIEQVGEQPDLDVRMADILSRAGRPAEAICYYENALRNQPNYLEATIKLGTHYLRFGKQELAARQFNKAMEINDEIVDSYIGLSISQHKAEESEDGYSTLSLAAAIQQNSTVLFSQTAMLHIENALKEKHPAEEGVERKSPEQLMEEIIKAHQLQISHTPKSPDIYYKYGILMMITGNFEEAVEAFENSLSINPTHHRVRCKLALCLYEMGQPKMAMDKLTEVDDLDPETLAIHYRTAVLYCDRRKFAEAMMQLENTMRENFTEPDAIVNIEVVLENLGLLDRASTTWDRLTETAKNSLAQ